MNSTAPCPTPEPHHWRAGGLHPVPRPFPIRSELLGLKELPPFSCQWRVVIFFKGQCSRCPAQLQALERFQSQNFGTSSVLQFFIVRAPEDLVEHSKSSEISYRQVVDNTGELFERAAFTQFPATLVLDPNWQGAAFFPGVVRFDDPPFEGLSNFLADRTTDGNNYFYSFFLVLAFVAGALVLRFILARRR